MEDAGSATGRTDLYRRLSRKERITTDEPDHTEKSMSTHATNTSTDTGFESKAQLDVLGDECARTILVATSENPRTAKELTARTDSSSATVYRRINNLLESGLLAECIRFEQDGSHTTAYESTIDGVHVQISADGIDVSIVGQRE